MAGILGKSKKGIFSFFLQKKVFLKLRINYKVQF